MKVKVGDTVKVITGENKNKEGKIITILKKTNRVVIENVNMIKKHVKPNGQDDKGGIREMEAPIHISNIKVITKEDKKAQKKEVKASKKEAKKPALKKVKESKK